MNLPDDLKFKPEDFLKRAFGETASEMLSDMTNALLAERLGEVEEVGQVDPCEMYWVPTRLVDRSQSKRIAYLVGVREL